MISFQSHCPSWLLVNNPGTVIPETCKLNPSSFPVPALANSGDLPKLLGVLEYYDAPCLHSITRSGYLQ